MEVEFVGDLSLAELLQDQESVYRSLQRNCQSDLTTASSSNPTPTQDHGQTSAGGNSSVTMNVEPHFASDEALARQLQELENLHSGPSLNEAIGTEAGITSTESPIDSGESSPASSSTQVAMQDSVEPDNMTYEELQSLGEAVGSESRGLSDELISYLLRSKYKSGSFFRKRNHEECVICRSTYKNRDKLITLPCQHYYHAKCISHWLKIRKACPVCNKEVFGP